MNKNVSILVRINNFICSFSLDIVSSDHIEDNANTSSDEMESDQPPSTTSRSQTEDEVVEIEGEQKSSPWNRISIRVDIFSQFQSK